jgi:hypothetical protein
MAKKQTAGSKDKKAAPKTEAAKPSDVTTLISAKELKTLLKRDIDIRDEIGELVGALREKIAYAVEKNHLDKDAFALVKKFKKWKPEKLAAVWPVLLVYMEMVGLMQEIDSVQSLPFEGDAEADGAEAESAPAPENVTRPRFGQFGAGGAAGT